MVNDEQIRWTRLIESMTCLNDLNDLLKTFEDEFKRTPTESDIFFMGILVGDRVVNKMDIRGLG